MHVVCPSSLTLSKKDLPSVERMLTSALSFTRVSIKKELHFCPTGPQRLLIAANWFYKCRTPSSLSAAEHSASSQQICKSWMGESCVLLLDHASQPSLLRAPADPPPTSRSFIAALRLSLALPLSSMLMHLTHITSPTFTSSSTLLTRCSASSEM
jgi:hypothetical protein